uniref:Estrogen sulfotransferase n=1 Tax=Cacopsylla melanoneura TaxID=428564 RepID=A0A8D8X4L2_9HEMI
MAPPDVLAHLPTQQSTTKEDNRTEDSTVTDTKSSSIPYVTYEKLEPEIATKLDAMFECKDCLLRVHPGRLLIPPKFQEMGEEIYNMDVHPDDVWVVSYPRTGSTWAQEMVWLLGNDLDFEQAQILAQLRNPLLELTALVANDPGDWKDDIPNSVDFVNVVPSPRFIKTHLPLELLPKQVATVKPKIVYIARNPKDVCVSFYHYCKLIHNLNDPENKYFNDFCELFLQGNVPLGPIMSHMLTFWNKRHEDNILFLKYEDMKKNQRDAIIQTAKFLGKEISDEQIDKLIDHLSFQKMRDNPATNLEPILAQMNRPADKRESDAKFMRKGVVGNYKNEMSDELIQRFDE